MVNRFKCPLKGIYKVGGNFQGDQNNLLVQFILQNRDIHSSWLKAESHPPFLTPNTLGNIRNILE